MNDEQDDLPRSTDEVAREPIRPAAQPRMFQSGSQSLRGVGGWLRFFIIGAGVLRPLYSFSELFGSDKVDMSRVQAMFPRTATLIYGERIIFSGLVIFGIVVAIMLWRVHQPISVTLAKIFLISNTAVFCLDVLVFSSYTDLPPQVIGNLQTQVISQMVITICLSSLWFAYFLKSERVKATYFSGPDRY